LTFPFAGIWAYRKSRLARKQPCRFANGNAGIERQYPFVVRQQRIDIELMDFRAISRHLGKLYQG
jgi:hypothetical protein